MIFSLYKYCRGYFEKHTLAFLLAGVVGVVAILPYILAPVALGDAYQGVPFFYQDSEDIYLSRIQEAVDGKWGISSPHFFEYKDENRTQQPFGEWIYALPSVVSGIAPATIALWSKFIFPAVLFFLVYLLLFRILAIDEQTRIWTALLGATLVVLAFDFTSVSFLRDVVSGNLTAPYLSVWTRIVNPITGGILLFALMNVLLSLYEKERASLVLVGGFILGIQSGYIFSFVLSGLLLGGAIVVAIIARRYRLGTYLFAIGLVALLINASYIVATIAGMGDVEGLSYSLKNGLFVTHLPLFNKFLFFALLILASSIFIIKKRNETFTDILMERWAVCALIGIFASLLALNLQVVFGKTIWPQHFVQYTTPIVFLVLVATSTMVFVRFHLLRIYRAIVILGIVVVFGLFSLSIPSYATALSDFAQRQGPAGVLEWLNDNAITPCVALVIEEKGYIASAVPAYTHCDLYISQYVFSVPMDRIEHNYFSSLYLKGVTPETWDEYFVTHADDMRRYFYRDWYDYFYHQADKWLAKMGDKDNTLSYFESKKKELKVRYIDFYKKDIRQELLKSKLDYVIWNFNGPQIWNSSEYQELIYEITGTTVPVYSSNGVFIFEMQLP
jgi:hypothetical protein